MRTHLAAGTAIALSIWLPTAEALGSTSGPSERDGRYLQAVRTFADNVLRYGRDTYGPKHTPLFIDGINVDTHEPALWELPAECAAAWKMPKRWVMSNLASQQNLFRVLDVLTTLTGDPKYRQAAVDALRYGFDHLQYQDGLLYWGGHAMIDLATKQVVGESHKDWSRNVPIPAYWDVGVVHELKHHFPYYELMWQVNPEATWRFIEAFWSSHVQNWSNLDMNRHGFYGIDAGRGWDHEYRGGPLPFQGKGLSILHGGSDLIYAGIMLYELNGDRRPLEWARRMTKRYADIRDPKTGLGADCYSCYHNERLLEQFGPEFGNRLTETTIVSIYGSRYSETAVCLLKLAERLGPYGEEFKQLALSDLAAYARLAYDPQDNHFWAMLIDGTKLTPADVKRPGTLAPDQFRKRPAGGIHFWAYALAARLSNDPLMWNMARQIGRGLGLGDMGDGINQSIKPDAATRCTDAYAFFGLLELHQATKNQAYLQLARRIGDNLLKQQFHNGFFVGDQDHLFAKFDSVTPPVLLHLEVRLHHPSVKLPAYLGSHSFFHCDYEGHGRTYDGDMIYSRVR